ncbi:MAG: dihydroorotase [Bacteroidetes bacterium]|nr:MAG: dihydroorotase [Bacteroidota bacterium]
MADTILIKNARIVNEGITQEGDLLIENGRIAHVDRHISPKNGNVKIIDAHGMYLIPGVIDDQVHFREPGLTHKADIATESRAAVAGGITSFIEQPNTVPQATTVELVEKKYERAAEVSAANYAFNIGATNDNVEELLKVDKTRIPGVKIFMGSSTGNMLVDDLKSLERIFSEVDNQLITHCEDEATIKANLEKYKAEFGDDIPMKYHPIIRSAEACYLSSSTAVDLAKKHDSRLHVYHISTGIETELFDNKLPLGEKKITAEACVHHLWFNDEDYDAKGSLIKWNPAVKTEEDRKAIWTALLDDRIDVIATDHAPHTREEKNSLYTSAPSGGPLVQHALVAMMEFVTDETITMEKLVEKMCHNPAILFNIKERGFIREGYHADLVLVEASRPWTVTDENVLSKCGWSPFEGSTFKARVSHTFVNGKVVYKNGQFDDSVRGERLYFDRD